MRRSLIALFVLSLTGYAQATSWSPQLSPLTQTTANRIRVTDINKDGIPDLLVAPQDPANDPHLQLSRYNSLLVYLGQNYGFGDPELSWGISNNPNGIGGQNASFPLWDFNAPIPYTGVGPLVPLTGGARGLPIREYVIRANEEFLTDELTSVSLVIRDPNGNDFPPSNPLYAEIENFLGDILVDWDQILTDQSWVLQQQADGSWLVFSAVDQFDITETPLPSCSGFQSPDFGFNSYNNRIGFDLPPSIAGTSAANASLLVSADQNTGMVMCDPPGATQTLLPFSIEIAVNLGSATLQSFNVNPGAVATPPDGTLDPNRLDLLSRLPYKQIAQDVPHPNSDFLGEPFLQTEFHSYDQPFGTLVNNSAPNPRWRFHTPLGPYTNGREIRDFAIGDILNRGFQDVVATSPEGIFIYFQEGPKATEPGFLPITSYDPTIAQNEERIPVYLDRGSIYPDSTSARANHWTMAVNGFLQELGGVGERRFKPSLNVTNFFFGGAETALGAVEYFPSNLVDYAWCAAESGAICTHFEPGTRSRSGDPGFDLNNYQQGSTIRLSVAQVNFRGEDDPITGRNSDVRISSSPYTAIALGDINRDGKLDIVAASENEGIRVILRRPNAARNLEDLDFNSLYNESAAVRLGTGFQFSRIELKDINNDRLLDIVAMSPGSANGVFVFLQNQGGGWTANEGPRRFAGQRTYSDFAVGDFDRDGSNDIALSSPIAGIDVFYGDQNASLGRFTWSVAYDASLPEADLANTGNGYLSRPIVREGFNVHTTYTVECLTPTQFIGPEKCDIALAAFDVFNLRNPNRVSRHTQGTNFTDGNVTFTSDLMFSQFQPGDLFTFVISAGPPTDRGFTRLRTLDINRDGKLDLVASGPDGVEVWQSSLRRAWTTILSPAPDRDIVDVAVKDLNKDGVDDLVLAERGGGVRLFTATDFDTVPPPSFTSPSRLLRNADALAVANVDNDLNSEVIFGTQAEVNNLKVAESGLRSGLRNPRDLVASPQNVASVAVGELNGDNRDDLVVGRQNEGLWVYFGEANGYSAPVQLLAGPQAPTTGTYNSIVIEDMDLDGRMDIVAGSLDAGFGFWRNLGGNTFSVDSTRLTEKVNDDGDPFPVWGLAVGDINQDGLPDVVAASDNRGGIFVYETILASDYEEQRALRESPFSPDLYQYYTYLRDERFVFGAATGARRCNTTSDIVCFVQRQRITHPDGFNSFFGLDLQDINNDGTLDLLAGSDRGLFVYGGQGGYVSGYNNPENRVSNIDSWFLPLILLDAGNQQNIGTDSSRGVAWGDINNDGSIDAVQATVSNGIQLYSTSLRLAARTRYLGVTVTNRGALPSSAGQGYRNVILHDMTNDGLLEVIGTQVASPQGSLRAWYALGDFQRPDLLRQQPVRPQDNSPIEYCSGEGFQLTFSEPMDTSTFTSDSFQWFLDGQPIEGTWGSPTLTSSFVSFYPLVQTPPGSEITGFPIYGVGNDVARDTQGNRLLNPVSLEESLGAVLNEGQNPVVSPQNGSIIAAGYMYSDYAAPLGGSFEALAIVREATGVNALLPDALELTIVEANGVPIPPSDAIPIPAVGDAGDRYYSFPSTNIDPDPNAVRGSPLLGEMAAPAASASDVGVWPNLLISSTTQAPAPAPMPQIALSQALQQSPFALPITGMEFVSRLQEGVSSMVERNAFGDTGRPYILAGGYGNTVLTPDSGVLEFFVFVADPQGIDNIAGVELEFLTPAGWRTLEAIGADQNLINDFYLVSDSTFSVGGFQLGGYGNFSMWGRRVSYENMLRLFRLLYADPTLFRLPEYDAPLIRARAVDIQGNSSTLWPYFTVE